MCEFFYSANIWQSYKQERGCLVHFGRLANTLLKDEESARDNHAFACNFAKYSPILNFFFTLKLNQQLQTHFFTDTAIIAGRKMIRHGDAKHLNGGHAANVRYLNLEADQTYSVLALSVCEYLPLSLQLPSQPLRGLLPVSLLLEQRHNGCEQFS